MRSRVSTLLDEPGAGSNRTEHAVPLLDLKLPRAYGPDLFQQRVATLFQHVYESYRGGPQEGQAA
jgi:hypothetical protein